jgi:formate hydrogenlyase subunit 3/multisubunit Na+/H+ antiporter MnhD subunit
MGSLAFPFLISGTLGKSQDSYHTVFPLSLLVLHTSIGAAMATNLFLFVIFFEMSTLCAFVMANADTKRFGSSYLDYFFYVLPSLFLVVLAGITLFGGQSTAYHRTISLVAVLIPVVFFVRLCLFLIFFSVPRVFGAQTPVSAPLGVSLLLLAGTCGYLQFFGGKSDPTCALIALGVLWTVTAAVYIFTGKNLRGLVVRSYITQTAFVLGLLFVAGSTREEALKWGTLPVLVNHVISGSGMFLCLSEDKNKGRLSGIYLIIFMGLLSGIIPSVGLIGRVRFFGDAYTLGGGFGIAVLVLFLINLFLLLWCVKAVQLVAEGWSKRQAIPMPLGQKASIIILLVYSFAPLFFYDTMAKYFSTLCIFLTRSP